MSGELAGKRVLVTSGPTRADLDAVRYISNRSTGRLGSRIAVEALRRGARVVLVAGPGSVVPGEDDLDAGERERLSTLSIVTVSDLMGALESELAADAPPDAVVHAMAVLDYVPDGAAGRKVPSGREEWCIRLVRSPKVVKHLRRWAPDALLVQFKLEVNVTEEELRERAIESLRKNRADLVVANDLSEIRGETHPALVLDPEGNVLARPGTKAEIARRLCDLLSAAL